jgi:hypothetical protein
MLGGPDVGQYGFLFREARLTVVRIRFSRVSGRFALVIQRMISLRAESENSSKYRRA